mgnify:FL=1
MSDQPKKSNFFEKLLLILVIYFKIHISYMTEEKWKLYFTNLSNRRVVFRFFMIHVVILLLKIPSV